MLNVSFRKKKDGYGKSYIVVNGVEDKKSWTVSLKDELPSAWFYDPKVIGILLSETFEELERWFESVAIDYGMHWHPYFSKLQIELRCSWNRNFPAVEIEVAPPFEEWAKPYSIVDYAAAIEGVIEKRKKVGMTFFQTDELISNGFGLRGEIASTSTVAKEWIDHCIEEMKLVCDQAEKDLIASLQKDSLLTYFNFPSDVRVVCEQYLLYFIQFLEDLGIEAKASLSSESQRVLFSVTPADGPSALAQVRDALELYLQLPGTPEIATGARASSEIAVQQLQANILHLQSQLMLTQAVATAHTATIEALQLSNFQYRQLIQSSTSKESDSESLIGDTVHVTKVEAKGIRVDVPLILRRLKRSFGIGDSKGT